MKMKYMDAVESRIIGKSLGDYPLLDVLKEKEKAALGSCPYLDKYHIQIRWAGYFQSSKDDYPHLLKVFIRQFKEAVYGDLYKKLHELKIAIYEQKRNDVHRILEEIDAEIS
jgi:hypothetical protein